MKSSLNQQKDDEIDILQLIKLQWDGRKTIIRVTIYSIILGLIISFIIPKKYTATTTIIPQTGSNPSPMLGLSSIASIAGIDLTKTQSDELPPSIYPQILQSIPFRIELANSTIRLQEIDDTISVFDYYDEIDSKKLLNIISKYTLELPYTLLNAIRRDNGASHTPKDNMISMSRKELEVLENISKDISLNINEDEGLVTISASMPEPLASAQFTKKIYELLQTYITEFKIEKAQSQLQFIQERYNEKKQEFEQAQKNLAIFRDQNKNVNTAIAQTEEERLQSEYRLALDVYTELAKQLETAKIKVKEDTPIFTIIEPVTIPVKRSKPRRLYILVVWTVLGIIAGIATVFIKNILNSLRIRWKNY